MKTRQLIVALSIAMSIAGLCAGLLAVADRATRPAIEENWRAERTRLAREIIEITPAVDPARAVSGACEGRLLLRLTTLGYAGEIQWLAAVDPNGGRLSLRAARHRETPGIGDFIDGDWLSERDSTSLAAWEEIDVVSGATITWRAVTRAVAEARRASGLHCE